MATKKTISPMNGDSYSSAMTREQFMFPETRITAGLMKDGLDDGKIVEAVCEGNLFQYPTEKSVRRMTKVCLRRLASLDDESLVAVIADGPSVDAKQVCLYAMMRQYRLVRDFMTTVIGEKFRTLDMRLTQTDMNLFFMRLQEQDDLVAAWSDSTIIKLKQVLHKLLVDNEYLDDDRSEELRPVLICASLENAIREKGDVQALAAFNCFS